VSKFSWLEKRKENENTTASNFKEKTNQHFAPICYITLIYYLEVCGTPIGVIIKEENLTFYHAGDTALFGDIRIIGDITVSI